MLQPRWQSHYSEGDWAAHPSLYLPTIDSTLCDGTSCVVHTGLSVKLLREHQGIMEHASYTVYLLPPGPARRQLLLHSSKKRVHNSSEYHMIKENVTRLQIVPSIMLDCYPGAWSTHRHPAIDEPIQQPHISGEALSPAGQGSDIATLFMAHLFL